MAAALDGIADAHRRGGAAGVDGDRGLYAPWLYSKIVSLGWRPFMRINKQGNFRPHGQGQFRSLASAAPEVGSAWCGKVDCFSGESSRLPCTLLARWDQGYEREGVADRDRCGPSTGDRDLVRHA